MTTIDPILEVLREIKSELVATRTDIGQLVRHAEHANMRLDEHSAILHEHSTILREHGAILHEHGAILREHGAILRRHEKRLESIDNNVAVLDRHAVATVATVELLHGGLQAIGRRFDLGQVGEQRLETRVDECERRLDVLEHGDDR